jgi:hypothetical protein
MKIKPGRDLTVKEVIKMLDEKEKRLRNTIASLTDTNRPAKGLTYEADCYAAAIRIINAGR